VADEIRNGGDMMGQFLGERQRVADQVRDTLPPGVIEALDVIGFLGVR
jgi:hypothetical protein